MSNRQFTQDHEWVEITDDIAVVGITEYAQDQLGDVVFVELPEVGATLAKGESLGTIESVKVASDFFAPVSGEIVEINPKLEGAPELLNSAPEGEGWIVKIKLSAPQEANDLMSAQAYLDHIA